jgi:ATP-dependent helicase/nuclease subunit A
VRDLLAAARAVADPSDRFAVVTALRSPLFGCGDDDLFVFRRDGGSFNILAPQPDLVAGTPVARAVAVLKDLSYRSRWMSPSELLGALVADRRMFEVVADDPRRSRDTWRRLRFVIDQARAWSEASRGGLRAYLAWAAFQGEEGSRVAEAVLPETDVESVRIMTVHAAKGLEFPIVILSGMSSARRPQYGVRVLWTETGCEVHTGKQTKTEEFDLAAPIDEQMGKLEHIRLLYVAATRARDHLIVSLHRTTKNVQTSARTIAEAQPEGFGRTRPEQVAGPITLPAQPVVAPPPAFAEWQARAHEAQANAKRQRVTNASGLEGTAPELVLAEATEQEQGRAKGQRDTELPPWTKGRYGSAIGRAVHGVLQVVDLAAGPLTQEFAAAVQAQSIAEGVVEQSDLVGTLAASALHSDVVRRAAAREHWRETFVGTVVNEEVVEGFVDLLYRDDDGTMVVVDYKTDAVRAGGIASRVQYYRPQIEAYLRAIRDATGAEARGVLVFLSPVAAVEEGVA